MSECQTEDVEKTWEKKKKKTTCETALGVFQRGSAEGGGEMEMQRGNQKRSQKKKK